AAESLKAAEERTSSVDSSSSSSASSVTSAAPVALLSSPRRRAPSGQLGEGSAAAATTTHAEGLTTTLLSTSGERGLPKSDEIPVPSTVEVAAVPDADALSADAATPLTSPIEGALTGEYSAAGPAASPDYGETGALSGEDGVSKQSPSDGRGAPPSSASATPLVGVSKDSVLAARGEPVPSPEGFGGEPFGTASVTLSDATSVATEVVISDRPDIPKAGVTAPLVAAGEEASAVAGGQPP
ncbi:hypothetical protein FOZ62_016621, partial [Perkinsus olseni]